MNKSTIHTFSAGLNIIGINPFVFLPENVLNAIFIQSKKNKGAIPVKGTINGKPFKQTLVKYRGQWRLYINTNMLKNSPKRIGEIIELSVRFDPIQRIIEPHPQLVQALNNHQAAKQRFDHLPPSLQKEIVRYISFLKQEKTVAANIVKAIGFLEGKNKFIGRPPINRN
jgi:hypothetical protein